MGHRAEVDARRRSRGFTLLELVVVLFVLALGAALALPVVGRTTDTLKTRAEVARFAAMLRHAHEQAINDGRAYRVVVSPADRRVQVVAGEDDVRETRTLPGAIEIQPVDPAAAAVRFEPQGVSNGGDFRLTADRVVFRITVDPLTGRVRTRRE
jgi:general secretion pathway protein H